jgi:hypothetical protein
MLFFLTSLGLFAAGIGLLDIAAGFPADLSFYVLPGQPIFLMFLLMGGLSMISRDAFDDSVNNK